MGHFERYPIGILLLTFCFGCYFWIASMVDAAAASSLHTPLDDLVPFIPQSIYLYASVYIMITLPIFVVRSPALFRRLAAAYAVIVVVCLVCFAMFPVSGETLRPSLAELDPSRFHVWGLHLNYGLDPPVNLFPSLHLAGTTIAALGTWKARRAYGAVALAAVVPIAIAVCTVKQHFVVDAVSGIALALAVYALMVRSYQPRPEESPVFDERGVVAFLAFLGSAYGALYLAFRAGLEPWTW